MKRKWIMPLIVAITLMSQTSCRTLFQKGKNARTEPKVMTVLVNGVDYRCLDKESFKIILKEAGRN